VEPHNRDGNTSKILDGEDGKGAEDVAEVREREWRAEEGIRKGRVARLCRHCTVHSTLPHLINIHRKMDGAGHLLSLKVMRVSVRACPAIQPRISVILVPSSDRRWRAHGSLSIQTRPLSQPTPLPPYTLSRVVPRSQATPKPYAT
jgi:hypothetical protein